MFDKQTHKTGVNLNTATKTHNFHIEGSYYLMLLYPPCLINTHQDIKWRECKPETLTMHSLWERDRAHTCSVTFDLDMMTFFHQKTACWVQHVTCSSRSTMQDKWREHDHFSECTQVDREGWIYLALRCFRTHLLHLYCHYTFWQYSLGFCGFHTNALMNDVLVKMSVQSPIHWIADFDGLLCCIPTWHLIYTSLYRCSAWMHCNDIYAVLKLPTHILYNSTHTEMRCTLCSIFRKKKKKDHSRMNCKLERIVHKLVFCIVLCCLSLLFMWRMLIILNSPAKHLISSACACSAPKGPDSVKWIMDCSWSSGTGPRSYLRAGGQTNSSAKWLCWSVKVLAKCNQRMSFLIAPDFSFLL